MRRRLVLSLLLASLATPAQLSCAQDAGVRAGGAQEALRTGDYAEARSAFASLLEEGATEHAAGWVEAHLQSGTYEQGLAAVDVLLARRPGDAHLNYARGRLLEAVGRYGEAEVAYRAAAEAKVDLWPNLLALGEVMAATGRENEARRVYAVLLRRYEEGAFRSAADLVVGARAAAHLGAFHQANAAFRTAYRVDARDPEVLRRWGDLLRVKYNEADARRNYEEALAVNPRHPGALVGLALGSGSFALQEELAGRALGANPNDVRALTLLSGLRLLDGLYDEALVQADRALGVDPNDAGALAHRAGVHHLRGETAAFTEVERHALSVNPRAGAFYRTLAEISARRFRYPDAAAFAEQAVRVDPADPAGYAALGTALLRLGRVEEARRAFEIGFDRDPFNLFVANSLTLIEEYAEFAEMESAHFTLLIHRDESDVLGPAILDLAEAAYAEFGARYPYEPEGKIRIEAYNDDGDFGVRIAGVPHLGLLGVSFGDVVAFDTPAAQPAGGYNWARTLWHELAHTMAIGVSDHRVPRWLTEGLAVYEERRARPVWGREMELELFAALDADRLLPLAEIDRGFTRPTFPGQVLLSYYHASRVVGYLAETYGFEKVVGLLQSLAEGRTMADSFTHVLGATTDELDAAFRARLRGERAGLAGVLQGAPDLFAEEDNEALLSRLTDRPENDYFGHLMAGRAALEAGDLDEAERRFESALALYGGFTGQGNPFEGLAAVHRARADTAALVGVLRRHVGVDEHAAGEARELGMLLVEAGAREEAASHLEASLDVAPYDLRVRETLAGLYESAGRYADAVRHRRAVLALDPVDRADAYYRLALSLRGQGQRAPARRAVLQALELAPGFRDAQRLLLRMVDGEG